MNSFMIEMALNAVGLTDAEKQQVIAALPAANEMVTLVNANLPFLQKMVQLLAIVGPAAQIVTQRLAPSPRGGALAEMQGKPTEIHGIRFVDGKFVAF